MPGSALPPDGEAPAGRSSWVKAITEGMGMERLELKRYRLPLGSDGVHVLVATEDERPQTVLMSYEGFLEVCGALLVAVEALRAAGLDPETLTGAQLTSDGLHTNGHGGNGYGHR